jgi:hypothetical protein
VAVDERLESAQDRCSLHPGVQAVATCHGCGRSMCLWCAIPVRGVAYGAECVGVVVGEEPRDEGETPRPKAPVYAVAGFGIALAATVLPWTTFGEGSTVFGAWSLSPRWALLAALSAAFGLAVAVLHLRRPRTDPRWDGLAIGLGAAVVLGAVLEWLRPPFPSTPSFVPWIAAAAGLLAAASAARCLLEDSRAAR